jgi:hypothetical protein
MSEMRGFWFSPYHLSLPKEVLMDWSWLIAVIALCAALAALAVGGIALRRARALGMGLGAGAGPLPARLAEVGQRLGALEAGQAGLEERLGRVGLRPAVAHYAPLGQAGARNCFALALLNREGDGVVVNYLSGTGVRVEAKEVRGWASAGPALTAEEEEAVRAGHEAWES